MTVVRPTMPRAQACVRGGRGEDLERRYVRMGQPPCVCQDGRCFRCQRDLARHQWAEANLALAKMILGTPPGEKTEAEAIAESVRGVRARPYCEKLWEE